MCWRLWKVAEWFTCWTSESLRVESCLCRDFGCVWLLSVMKFVSVCGQVLRRGGLCGCVW